MKKIGGINMNTTTCLKGKTAKKNTSIYTSIKEGLKEVKLHKQGKIHLKTWDELYNELKNEKEWNIK